MGWTDFTLSHPCGWVRLAPECLPSSAAATHSSLGDTHGPGLNGGALGCDKVCGIWEHQHRGGNSPLRH